MKKILGIGSALVDILTQIPNEQILNEYYIYQINHSKK